MSYVPRVLLCSLGSKCAGKRGSRVLAVAPGRTDEGRFAAYCSQICSHTWDADSRSLLSEHRPVVSLKFAPASTPRDVRCVRVRMSRPYKLSTPLSAHVRPK